MTITATQKPRFTFSEEGIQETLDLPISVDARNQNRLSESYEKTNEIAKHTLPQTSMRRTTTYTDLNALDNAPTPPSTRRKGKTSSTIFPFSTKHIKSMNSPQNDHGFPLTHTSYISATVPKQFPHHRPASTATLGMGESEIRILQTGRNTENPLTKKDVARAEGWLPTDEELKQINRNLRDEIKLNARNVKLEINTKLGRDQNTVITMQEFLNKEHFLPSFSMLYNLNHGRKLNTSLSLEDQRSFRTYFCNYLRLAEGSYITRDNFTNCTGTEPSMREILNLNLRKPLRTPLDREEISREIFGNQNARIMDIICFALNKPSPHHITAADLKLYLGRPPTYTELLNCLLGRNDLQANITDEDLCTMFNQNSVPSEYTLFLWFLGILNDRPLLTCAQYQQCTGVFPRSWAQLVNLCLGKDPTTPISRDEVSERFQINSVLELFNHLLGIQGPTRHVTQDEFLTLWPNGTVQQFINCNWDTGLAESVTNESFRFFFYNEPSEELLKAINGGMLLKDLPKDD